MGTQKVDREARKQQILTAAIELFARKGFYGTSMDDIVRETGLSKGGVYWHFKSKDDIIAAVLEQLYDLEWETFRNLATQPGTVQERLQAIFGKIAADMDDIEAMSQFQPIAMEFYAVAARREDLRQVIKGYFQQYRTLLTTLIQQGLDVGELVFPSHPNAAEQIAITFVAQLEGIALLWAVDPEAVDMRSQLEIAFTMLLRGLQAGGEEHVRKEEDRNIDV